MSEEDDRRARYEAQGKRPRLSISAWIKPETMDAIDRKRADRRKNISRPVKRI